MGIPKTYDHKQAEQQHYARREEQGLFAPEINHDPTAPVYAIVIPPPNVTRSLPSRSAPQRSSRWRRL